ncbi:MAG TPA: DUF4272 domain-containing protein [Allosphingosinicella sp.]|nr:DUF4272 domain-containing protein [Allosphingosinicella sp.]
MTGSGDADSAASRTRRSAGRLSRLGIIYDIYDPSIGGLPGMPALARPAELIAGRAICLCLCASKAEGLDPSIARDLAEDFEATAYLTDAERRYLLDDEPVTVDRARFLQWRFEACWLLLWVLGHIPHLADPVATCDAKLTADIIRASPNPESLSMDRPHRDIDTILDEADFNHRALQVCISSGPPFEAIPGGLLAAVVYQREHAFRWLLAGPDCPWDDIVIDVTQDAAAC